MPLKTPALTLNHVGLCVDDIDESVTWYGAVFGFVLLDGPLDIQGEGSDDLAVARVMLGADLNHIRVAHMAAGDGVGFELFQFVDPDTRDGSSEREWRQGLFHLCVTHPDVEELRERIEHNGGKARTDILPLRSGSSHLLCYCEDPSGNVIELMSARYEQIFANRS